MHMAWWVFITCSYTHVIYDNDWELSLHILLPHIILYLYRFSFFCQQWFILSTTIYMILQHIFLRFQLILGCHWHTYLPKNYKNNCTWLQASCRWRKYQERWLKPPTYTIINMQKTFILSHLFLKPSCFWKIASESPLITLYLPFSVCNKISQISLTTSTTFHWISWNILQHLWVHKTHKIIELFVSQTIPFSTNLIGINDDVSSI